MGRLPDLRSRPPAREYPARDRARLLQSRDTPLLAARRQKEHPQCIEDDVDITKKN